MYKTIFNLVPIDPCNPALNNVALQQINKMPVAKSNLCSALPLQEKIEVLLGSIKASQEQIIKSKAINKLLNDIERNQKPIKRYSFNEALTKTRSDYSFIIKALEDK